jgi:hypothetical protein
MHLPAALASAVLVLPFCAALTGQSLSPSNGDLRELLARAGRYVSKYEREASAVVCEERFEQVVERVTRKPSLEAVAPELRRRREKRVLVSDFLLVQVPGEPGWTPFRDVYSVDGVAVRDREERLTRLFLDPKLDALERADRIREESSRYNLGAATRDINVPTFVLGFLKPGVQTHFAFRSAGQERVGQVDTEIVDYEETGRPTIVRGARFEDVPARGRVWIDRATGAVLGTVLRTEPYGLKSSIEVTYRFDPAMALWVPAEMVETHEVPGEITTGRATYTNFRRFKVETFEHVEPGSDEHVCDPRGDHGNDAGSRVQQR